VIFKYKNSISSIGNIGLVLRLGSVTNIMAGDIIIEMVRRRMKIRVIWVCELDNFFYVFRLFLFFLCVGKLSIGLKLLLLRLERVIIIGC
jgi:hypothetical protein